MAKQSEPKKGKVRAAERVRGFFSELTLKRIGAILLCGFLCACIGYGAAKTFMRPVYSSAMTLAVINPTHKGDNDINNLAVCYRLATSLANAGSGNYVAAQNTIKRLGLNIDADAFFKKIRVRRKDKTMLVKVRGMDPNPALAKQIAQVYAEEIVTELADQLYITNVEVLYGPSKPTRIGGAGDAAYVGGALGIFLALAFFYIKSRSSVFIKDAKDLQRYGKPVIGQILVIRNVTRAGQEEDAK